MVIPRCPGAQQPGRSLKQKRGKEGRGRQMRSEATVHRQQSVGLDGAQQGRAMLCRGQECREDSPSMIQHLRCVQACATEREKGGGGGGFSVQTPLSHVSLLAFEIRQKVRLTSSRKSKKAACSDVSFRGELWALWACAAILQSIPGI